MPRTVTVTLSNGQQHVYQNVPDDVTPDAITARAQSEFGSAPTNIDGGRGGQGEAASEPETSPRWDVLGDIGRAAKASAGALVDDFSAAFPSMEQRQAKQAENRENFGLIGGIAKGAIVDPVVGLGHALKVPLDALGVVSAPLTGALHATVGSALSYLPSPEPGTDMKALADESIDTALMGLGPRGMGRSGGPRVARAEAAARNAERNAASVRNQAKAKVAKRAEQDGLTAQDVLDAQAEATANGDKLTLMDIGGENTRGLAGAVYRTPGDGKQRIGNFLDERDSASASRLADDIQGSVGSGSTYQAVQNLARARSTASKEPFAEAFASDSIAPFEQQLSSHLSRATGAKGQIAKQIAEIERSNPGALASRGAAGKAVREKYMDLRDQLAQAEADRVSTMEMFRRAQSDRVTNAPGAIWSPRLQEFMDHPDVQAGLKAGLKLEKQDAISERRPFKDEDYAITGWDEKGDPVVSSVPTMKGLAAAKEGLSAKVAEMVDPLTGRPTKAGLSLKKFRDAFVSELDTLNPKYKVARDAWSGPSQSMEAARDGRQHFSRAESDAQVKAEFAELSPGDKEFYRLGAAEAKIAAVEGAADAADKSKRVINSIRDRKRFEMLFDNPADAKRFMDSVGRKRKAFDTKIEVKGNSKTAARNVEDEDAAGLVLEGARGIRDLTSGNWFGLADQALRMRQLGIRNNPALNSEIANILTNPDFAVGGGGNFFAAEPVPRGANYLANTGLLGELSAVSGSTNAPRPEPRPSRK